jgi:hypothetical protein
MTSWHSRHGPRRDAGADAKTEGEAALMAAIARKGSWLTCSGRGASSERFPTGVPLLHDIAQVARDIESGEAWDASAFENWQQPAAIGMLCLHCGAPFWEAPNVLHIDGAWRDRPTAAPARKEFATMVEIVLQRQVEEGRRDREAWVNALDARWPAELAEARRLDAEIARAAEPSWWARLWQRVYAAVMRFGHQP